MYSLCYINYSYIVKIISWCSQHVRSMFILLVRVHALLRFSIYQIGRTCLNGIVVQTYSKHLQWASESPKRLERMMVAGSYSRPHDFKPRICGRQRRHDECLHLHPSPSQSNNYNLESNLTNPKFSNRKPMYLLMIWHLCCADAW
jgi:hypothetical protein